MAKTTGNGLRELKRIKRPKPNRCDGHYWLIDHTIYACDALPLDGCPCRSAPAGEGEVRGC